MDASTLANIRLSNQQLIHSKLTTPSEVVSWMGAMQAQDYQMAKWAVGLRLPASTDKMIEQALTEGQIIRTHILRPTWHFVTPEDIRWMLPLSAPRVRAAVRAADKMYGFTDEMVARNNKTVAAIIEKNGHLTRLQIEAELNKLGITTDDNNRMAHIMMRAELDGVVCSGEVKGNKQSYCLLDERVASLTPLPQDEALEKLARKYFTSHAPATLHDFVWWSGMKVADARLGMELIKNDFEIVSIGSANYWVNRSANAASTNDKSIHLLPAFDEFIVSYKDRKHIFVDTDYKKIITSNGIFRPAITRGGHVVGAWKRSKKKSEITAESEMFDNVGKKTLSEIDLALDAYKLFNVVANPNDLNLQKAML